jgi:uncharacterized protein YeaO (DUF488 family)
MVKIKRVYNQPEKGDGKRVLVDRLWPRGMKKEDAGLDLWLKDIAPSDELRKWFSHDPSKWQEFRKRYRKELKDKQDMIEDLRKAARRGTVTLLYAAKDADRNNAVVLKEMIEEYHIIHSIEVEAKVLSLE